MMNQSARPAGDGVAAASRGNGEGGGWGSGRGSRPGAGSIKSVDRLEGYRLALELASAAPAPMIK